MLTTVKEAKEQLKSDYMDYQDCWEDFANNIEDTISECADGNVDIYYNKLAEWFPSNWHKIDNALYEFGKFPKDSEGYPDIMKAIQWGQYQENYNLLQKAYEELKEEHEEETE